ncbi:MAG: DUF2177 family protein [bacterium]|nr:DUF2177 family protein [bacterium]
MSMFIHYVATLLVFLAVDMIWLGGIAKGLYRAELGHLMRPAPLWSAALIFYALYVVGILFFVVYPARGDAALTRVFFTGAFFGLIAYATFDLTSLAVIRDWPLRIVFIDLAWGAVITGITATVSARILRLLA